MPDTNNAPAMEQSLARSRCTGKQTWQEIPTWILVTIIYAGWIGLTWFYNALPWWLVLPLGGWLVAWQNSFQHEALHGHPSRSKWLNEILAGPPLGLWMPYAIYRDGHLAHHETGALTDPLDDPESFYSTPDRWAAANPAVRAVLVANNTLAGRMIIGPWITALSFWAGEARRLLSGDLHNARAWLLHLVLCAAVLVWLGIICAIPLLDYVLFFAWPGLSLTLLRSYTEHRPAESQEARSALVEAGPLLGLLFLNNNLHLVHHLRPEVPWFALPGVYRAERDGYRERNRGFLFRGGYLEIARRFGLRPKDLPVHPG